MDVLVLITAACANYSCKPCYIFITYSYLDKALVILTEANDKTATPAICHKPYTAEKDCHLRHDDVTDHNKPTIVQPVTEVI